MLNIGIVGLGNIAQKAYLPVMREIEGVKWYPCSRNKENLKKVTSLFGRAVPCETIEELLQFPLDGVFVHVATAAHAGIVKQILEAGIPVYVDKPITADYEQTEALYRIAKANNTFLMAGFNRRFAPKVQEMKKIPDKKRILVEKNAIDEAADMHFKLYDLFIHPLDTALYLMDGRPVKGSFYYKKDREQLEQVTVYLESLQEVAIASMNVTSGARREIIEVQSTGGTYSLQDLSELTIYQGPDRIEDRFGSWETTLYKRGFVTIVQAFLSAIQTGGKNPVSPYSSLLSHLICNRIDTAKASEGFLSFTLPEEFLE